MKLHLLRHADYDPVVPAPDTRGPGLNARGRAQAETLAATLMETDCTLVIVSPLRRTRETVLPFLARKSSCEIIESPALLEADSIDETYNRAQKFFSDLKNSAAARSVLVCGHQNFLVCLELAIKRKPIDDFFDTEPLDYAELRVVNFDAHGSTS